MINLYYPFTLRCLPHFLNYELILVINNPVFLCSNILFISIIKLVTSNIKKLSTNYHHFSLKTVNSMWIFQIFNSKYYYFSFLSIVESFLSTTVSHFSRGYQQFVKSSKF